MNGVSRRVFLASAAVASAALAGGRAEAATLPLLLHDAQLAAGRRFAARARLLGGKAVALEGDRVRQMRDLLAAAPAAIFAVTRRSDELLVGEIAAEAGYLRVALVRHGRGGLITANCAPDGVTIGALAQFSDAAWPEAFAELALDKIGQCAVAPASPALPALSWMMTRR
ncbi:hypothetical protein [Sphingobium cupriresistens]|uniref:Uncharacterized protein n=1 Tax=Sphingobium cupriresistens TaxID=1132417 RepID=A0A8G1ZH08_9SPHN|nr:hypothetical protein [Sphingobium cupriresistens]RYM09970.1 hypothetical protein EWH12_13040 [Sphingobium cupriresistens]